MPQHSKEKRERYAKGLRYSEDATHKKRQNNCLKWHLRAVEKYGQAFDYVSTHSQRPDHISQQPLNAISNNYFDAFYEWHPQNNAILLRTSRVSLLNAVA